MASTIHRAPPVCYARRVMRSAPFSPTSPRRTVCSVRLPPAGGRAPTRGLRDRSSSRTTRFPRATTHSSAAISSVRPRRVSRRLGRGSGTRHASNARAARRVAVHGAWPRHQLFGAVRLAHSTSNDRHKSCAAGILGRCLKVLCVAGATHRSKQVIRNAA